MPYACTDSWASFIAESHFSKGPMTPQCLPQLVQEMTSSVRIPFNPNLPPDPSPGLLISIPPSPRQGLLIPTRSLGPSAGWIPAIGGGIYKGLGALVSLAIHGEVHAAVQDEDERFLLSMAVDEAAARVRGLDGDVVALEQVSGV